MAPARVEARVAPAHRGLTAAAAAAPRRAQGDLALSEPIPVYVASPLGFTEAGRRYLASTVLPALADRGLAALDPWNDEDGTVARLIAEAAAHSDVEARNAALGRLNRHLGRRNVELIGRARAVLALLDGCDVDSGTASEIGYACARGLPVVGWRDDLRSSGENEATAVNLQVAYFVELSGGTIEPSFEAAVETLVGVLSAA